SLPSEALGLLPKIYEMRAADYFFVQMELLGYGTDAAVAGALVAAGYTGQGRSGSRGEGLAGATVNHWRNHQYSLPSEALGLLPKIPPAAGLEEGGAFLRQKREVKGWMQRELAAAVGVTSSYIARIENGTSLPSYRLLRDLGRVLEFDPKDFWTRYVIPARREREGLATPPIPHSPLKSAGAVLRELLPFVATPSGQRAVRRAMIAVGPARLPKETPVSVSDTPEAARKRMGEFIRQKRQGKGWTQGKLAQESNVVSSYITKLEKGSQSPGRKLSFALSKALGFDPNIFWQEYVSPARMGKASATRGRGILRRGMGIESVLSIEGQPETLSERDARLFRAARNLLYELYSVTDEPFARQGMGAAIQILDQARGEWPRVVPITREYGQERAEALTAMDAAEPVWQEEGVWEKSRWPMEHRPSTGTLLKDVFELSFAVEDEQGRPAAYLYATHGQPDYPVTERYPGVFIFRLSVRQDHKGRKLAPLLLLESARAAMQKGIEGYVTLETDGKNSHARHVYESLGFEVVGERIDERKPHLVFIEYAVPIGALIEKARAALIRYHSSAGMEEGGGGRDGQNLSVLQNPHDPAFRFLVAGSLRLYAHEQEQQGHSHMAGEARELARELSARRGPLAHPQNQEPLDRVLTRLGVGNLEELVQLVGRQALTVTVEKDPSSETPWLYPGQGIAGTTDYRMAARRISLALIGPPAFSPPSAAGMEEVDTGLRTGPRDLVPAGGPSQPTPAGAGLEERPGARIVNESRRTALFVPQGGLLANWYTDSDGEEIPLSLLEILDPDEERIVVPLADVSSQTAVFVQEGVLPEPVMEALRVAGVQVKRFTLDKIPQGDPARENVYVMDVPLGSERREWIRDPQAIVINLRPAGPKGRPGTPQELGALINVAREADERILQAGPIHRSSDPELRNAVIAIDTQL
ncbi:MAG: GNAT family N-acetyltransferase, partial [Candidatus Omnitrophica bacterium]|nr:GNAT family N-acetyltransferase [Candidatus Omnitrophota bacterium]